MKVAPKDEPFCGRRDRINSRPHGQQKPPVYRAGHSALPGCSQASMWAGCFLRNLDKTERINILYAINRADSARTGVGVFGDGREIGELNARRFEALTSMTGDGILGS